MEVAGLSQKKNVESIDSQCFKEIDLLATALVGGGGGKGNGRSYISDGSGIWIRRGMIPVVTGIGNTRGPWGVTEKLFEFWEEIFRSNYCI